jgi:hypothetical protein
VTRQHKWLCAGGSATRQHKGPFLLAQSCWRVPRPPGQIVSGQVAGGAVWGRNRLAALYHALTAKRTLNDFLCCASEQRRAANTSLPCVFFMVRTENNFFNNFIKFIKVIK